MVGGLPLPSKPSVGAGIWNSFQGACDSSPTFHEGHHGIFKAHQLMLEDGTPGLMSIPGTAHTQMPAKHQDEFTVGSRFEPRLESSEASAQSSR